MEKAKKHSSVIIKKILARIKPLDQFKTYTKMGLAARLSDLIKSKTDGKLHFASLVDKHPSEISRWLGGSHNFTIDTLCEISFVLQIPVKDLFFVEENGKSINLAQIENSENSGFSIPKITDESRHLTSNSNLVEGMANGKHHVSSAHERHSQKPKNIKSGEKTCAHIPASRKNIKRSM